MEKATSIVSLLKDLAQHRKNTEGFISGFLLYFIIFLCYAIYVSLLRDLLRNEAHECFLSQFCYIKSC